MFSSLFNTSNSDSGSLGTQKRLFPILSPAYVVTFWILKARLLWRRFPIWIPSWVNPQFHFPSHKPQEAKKTKSLKSLFLFVPSFWLLYINSSLTGSLIHWKTFSIIYSTLCCVQQKFHDTIVQGCLTCAMHVVKNSCKCSPTQNHKLT